MPRQAVVVGAGLGGLSAAIHLRLEGWDVLVIEQREGSGGKASPASIQGFRLDPGPSIVILTHLYEEVFRRAGRDPREYLRFQRLDPWTRVFFEGESPFDLPADEDECLRMLTSFAPQDAEPFRELMHRLERAAPLVDQTIFRHPIHQPWQLASPAMARFARHISPFQAFRPYIDARFKSPILRAFFYGFPSYSGQSYDSAAPGALLIPYYMLRHGVWWPEGGVGAIPTAFERLARELGVEFRFGATVSGLEHDGRRVTSVILGQERIAAEVVISNRDRLSTREWIEPQPDLKPSFSYFTVHAGLDRTTDVFGHHTLFIPREFEAGFEQLYRTRTFPAVPIVYVNETTSMDRTTAPPGFINLFFVVTSPAREDHLDWDRDEDEYTRRTLGALARHSVEIGPNDLTILRVQSPAVFERRDGNYRGSLYGPDERYRLWGFMPARCADEKLVNLFYCGGSVQPGAGMPMVTLSGRFAAELASRVKGPA